MLTDKMRGASVASMKSFKMKRTLTLWLASFEIRALLRLSIAMCLWCLDRPIPFRIAIPLKCVPWTESKIIKANAHRSAHQINQTNYSMDMVTTHLLIQAKIVNRFNSAEIDFAWYGMQIENGCWYSCLMLCAQRR